MPRYCRTMVICVVAITLVHTTAASLTCTWNPDNGTMFQYSASNLSTTCAPLSGAHERVTVTLDDWEVETGVSVSLIDTRTVAFREDEVLPKGRLKVAAITIGFGTGDGSNVSYVQERVALAVSKLQEAKAAGATLALLPEEFCGTGPVAANDTTIHMPLVAAARALSMYVAYGVRVKAPPGDLYNNDLGYNTAVLIAPSGETIGEYKKEWPCCVAPDGTVGNDGNPSREGVRAWDVPGIGRVAFLTCYDANFAESWFALYAARVDLVLWPSAYGGGLPLRAYAALHHYAIVPAGWGDITDVTGQVAADLAQPTPDVFVATLDLDKTFVHTDFDETQVDALLHDHAGDVELETLPEYCAVAGRCAQTADLFAQSNFRLLRRTEAGAAKGVTVRNLLTKYQIRDLRSYQLQARAAINRQRQRATP
eukprot:m.188847 g.188847  ORF g.188847 m.188847 type:complete len:424 (-) comp17565_c0_seq1:100-1371(-)